MTPSTEFVIELARREGVLSEEALTSARNHQLASTGGEGEPASLAEAVVTLGLVDEAALCGLLARELGIEIFDLAKLSIEGEALRYLSAEHARRYRAIPVNFNGGTVVIAIADPMNLSAVDELAMICGCNVETVLAPTSEILAAIDRHYGSDQDPDLSSDPAGTSVGPGAAAMGVTAPEGGEDAPIIQRVHAIIADAVRRRASDIHLEPLERRFRVRYRIDGRLLEVESPPKRLQLPLISRVKIMADLSIAEKRLPQDGRIQRVVDGRPIDLRVSSVPTAHGESVVMRLLDAEGLKPGIGELGLSAADAAQLRRLIGLADGMVLVTGPTGSGKTTTLYSCLHDINRPDRKIITVEDPVEYQLTGVNQVPVRSEVGLSFAAALRAMLRQAPNVVMVGEIRDRETAEIAINAALTGHLVFSTLHTNDAPGAITRLFDLGVKPFLVASALRAVVAQRLVRRVCDACAQSFEPDEATRQIFALHGIEAPDLRCREGSGCSACNNTGYRGRLAIFEFFVVNEETERLIHRHAELPTLRSAARHAGMRTLRFDGIQKAAAGFTTLDEVMAATVADESI